MVCLGNICRSPLAEGILDSLTSNKIKLDSAGTSNFHIESHPDKRMIEQGHKYGVDISKFRARQFNTSDFEKFDRIYAMDEQNKVDILRLAKNKVDQQKVYKILGNNADVPDPYFGDQDGFELVYQLLKDKCQEIANEIDG